MFHSRVKLPEGIVDLLQGTFKICVWKPHIWPTDFRFCGYNQPETTMCLQKPLNDLTLSSATSPVWRPIIPPQSYDLPNILKYQNWNWSNENREVRQCTKISKMGYGWNGYQSEFSSLKARTLAVAFWGSAKAWPNGRSSEMERKKDSRYSSKILGRYPIIFGHTHALNFHLFAVPEGMAQASDSR